ncbi:MAG: YwaF family protein [Eubacteriales bacterium]|nr:YwaF family protein [Eubacteriales bacterium]
MNRPFYIKKRPVSQKKAVRILFCCGVLLALGEAYKQIFLYVFINHGRYDWWFFPFQLCSLPMYLCLLLPFLKKKAARTAVCTFMQDFNLLGGVAALCVPEGFMGIHWSLTLHGFLWHITLVLIGIFIWACGLSDRSARGYVRTLPIFFAGCALATAVNVLSPGRGRADMFYISPYFVTTQPVFHTIGEALGILPANLLYLASICLGGWLVHLISGHLKPVFSPDNAG